MLPDSTWSSSFNKSELKISSVGSEWKSFMNECLMGTEIFKKNENDNSLPLDPNFVMDVRHKMVKESTKIIPLPQAYIHSEALNILRMENQNRLLKQKEGKLVEKEIGKLKQTLENHRLLTKQKLNETTNKKIRYLSNSQNFPKQKILFKRLEFCNPCKCQSVEMKMEATNRTVFSKREELSDDLSEPVSVQKGSVIEDENECKKQLWEALEGKNEIMKRFLENGKEDVIQSEKIRESPNVDLVSRRSMEQAWRIWRIYTQKLKTRKREKQIYQNKIEAFLVKLKENEKEENPKNSNLKKLIENRRKELPTDKKDERLEKLMKEIKISQNETYQKLKELKMRNQNKSLNTEFLKRMEERRAERLKRRKEIEEKKRKIEEEKEKIQKEKEEEKKRLEEEFKRRNAEEFKEKRRLEKERKEEMKKAREKLRMNMKLADSHYEKYVIRSYGFRPWKALVKISKLQNERAFEFYETKLKQKAFWAWKSNIKEALAFRFNTAQAFYERMLKKQSFFIWMMFYKEKIKQNQVAMDWNDFKIIERAFKSWLLFTQNECLDYLNKKYIAELNYERKLKKKCLTKLRGYPELKKLEQARENRKMKWRLKVKEILPDYRPIDIVEGV